MATLKEIKDFSRGNVAGQMSLARIQSGCLMRIADATELMVRNYDKLLNENSRLRHRNEDLDERTKHRNRQIYALRGVITKMKKKLGE